MKTKTKRKKRQSTLSPSTQTECLNELIRNNRHKQKKKKKQEKTNIRLRQARAHVVWNFGWFERVNFVPKVEREFSGIRFVLFHLILRSFIRSLFPILYASEVDILASMSALSKSSVQIERYHRVADKFRLLNYIITNISFYQLLALASSLSIFRLLSFRWERRTRIMRNRNSTSSCYFGPAFIDRCIANDQLFYGFKWMPFFHFRFESQTRKRSLERRRRIFFEWRRKRMRSATSCRLT